jgi:hypothetical protein
MQTADMVAEFLRLRKANFQLIASRFADAVGTSPAMISAVLKGERTFPLKLLDETALFFGCANAIEFLILAREEVKKAGRWPPEPTPDEAERLRLLRFRGRLPPEDE